MAASLTLLALLEQEPAHGYTLKRKYDQRFARSRPLAFGQVYASLARFERQGWAQVSAVEAGEGPERKRYRITGEGVEVVDTWVTQPQPAEEFATSELYARVSIALLSGRSAARLLDDQREAHLSRMRELTAQRRRADAVEMLAITYELTHLDADLRWIEDAGRRLDEAKQALQGEAS